jgi:hypothetical protein
MKKLKDIIIVAGILGFCTVFWLAMVMALGSALLRIAQ